MLTNGQRILLMGDAAVNRLLKLFIFICLTNSFGSFAAEANYANLFDKHGSPFGVGSSEVRLVDVIFPATQCGPSDEYVCVLSKVFVFSVPKDIETRAWKHGGATYKVLAKKEKLIRGEIIEYRVIRQELKGNVIEYAYSNDYGVLAIKGKNGHVMMAMGKCGFAAISNARGCQQD
jgi:hypothetical protein